MNLLRIPWRILRIIVHLLRGVLVSLTTKRYPTRNGESLPDPQVVSDWLAHLLGILSIKVNVQGTPPHQPALLVANHVSWLDIPVIASLTHSGFLSKHGIRKWPVVGWLAASAGTVFIKRGKGEAQQVSTAISQRLLGDHQLALFPEGTTTKGTQVKRFFPRLFAPAIDTNTAVVPITLFYSVDGKQDFVVPFTDHQHFVGSFFRILGRKSSEVLVIFGEPIPPKGHDRRSLAEQAHTIIAGNLQHQSATTSSSV